MFDFRQSPSGGEHLSVAAEAGAPPGNLRRAGEIKKLPTCKPDPVPALLRVVIIYLAPALLQGSSCLPSGASSLRKASGEPPSDAGIRGISACKVYPRRQLPAGAVGSYPTFSSSPRARPVAGRCDEAVIFCGTLCERVSAFVNAPSRSPVLSRCIALCCPDFPPPV
jgi:hypothetical protein